ncbi:hypothetical protein [Polaromonas sp.]|jgi:hypothetical protein|uniref:hypothetical protein n=1 Tax=Polaromonas sp. TaxID=1869339 RepID=UPI0037C93734
MLKSIWKDPVWGAVIATGIATAVGAIGTYSLGFWPAISAAAASAWQFLLASTQVRIWVLVVLALPVILLLFLIVIVIWGLWSNSSVNQPTWTTYTTDMFFGLRWRWRYVDGSIDRLNTFCPHCDYQVFPQRASAYEVIDRIAFKCDSCHQSVGTFDESYDQLQGKTERFIQQKLRNNTWQATA